MSSDLPFILLSVPDTLQSEWQQDTKLPLLFAHAVSVLGKKNVFRFVLVLCRFHKFMEFYDYGLVLMHHMIKVFPQPFCHGYYSVTVWRQLTVCAATPILPPALVAATSSAWSSSCSCFSDGGDVSTTVDPPSYGNKHRDDTQNDKDEICRQTKPFDAVHESRMQELRAPCVPVAVI